MTGALARGPEVAPRGAASPKDAPRPSSRSLKWAATISIAVPGLLLGGLVAMVEEPEVSILTMFVGAAFACGVLIGWRWPFVGGSLVAVGGILLEWSWFTGPLEGDVQAFIDSIDSVSPLWVTIAALISGALFAWAGMLERRRRV